MTKVKVLTWRFRLQQDAEVQRVECPESWRLPWFYLMKWRLINCKKQKYFPKDISALT